MAEETKRFDRSEKSSMPVTVVASLISAIIAGGGGSYATGASVASTLREGMVRLEGQVQALREEVRRQGEDSRAAILRLDARAEGLDMRLRAAELRLERLAPSPPR
jgi:outer membrane murein-binding lipoprotein Lpp